MEMNEKPLLRGHFHQSAFFAALGACTVLLAQSTTWPRFLALFAYSLSLCGMCGVSALYHRRNWRSEARARMRKLDHAFIFVLIGGTATPTCWIGMGNAAGFKLLLLIWSGVVLGVAQALFIPHRLRWLSVALYATVGGLALPYVPELGHSLGVTGLSLIWAGSAAYIVGALAYALKRPNPWPGVLGYHEIFHIFVILGAAFHFIEIARVVR